MYGSLPSGLSVHCVKRYCRPKLLNYDSFVPQNSNVNSITPWNFFYLLNLNWLGLSFLVDIVLCSICSFQLHFNSLFNFVYLPELI